MTANTRSKFSWWLLAMIALLIAGIGGQLNKLTTTDAKTQSALREAKQWQQMIEDCDTAFIVFNNDHEIIQWNRGAQLLLGWSEAEAVGANIELIIPTERYEKGVWSESSLKKSISKITEIDGYLLHKNGKVLHSNIRLMAVVNSQILYVIQIVRPELLDEYQMNNSISSDLAEPHDITRFRVKK